MLYGYKAKKKTLNNKKIESIYSTLPFRSGMAMIVELSTRMNAFL